MWQRLKSKKVLAAIVGAALLLSGAPQAPLLAPMLVEVGCQAVGGCEP